MTPGQWLTELQQRLGHSMFPEDYIVFDVETTGRVFYGAQGSYTPDRHGYHDLITQIGHCIVRGGEVKHSAGVVLDWTRPEVASTHEFDVMRDQQWLRDQLDFLDKVFTEKGRTYQVPYTKMQAEGRDPIEIIRGYYDIFNDAREQGLKFVGHNAWGFDVKMVRYHFRQCLNEDFKWRSDEVIDTGMIEKAIQDADNENISLPWPTENLKTWSRRIANSPRAGISWNLDQHVVNKYNLIERYNLNMDEAHDAGFDCYLTHLLLETYKAEQEAAS